MLKKACGKYGSLLLAAVVLIAAPQVFADDADDAMAVVQQWADLEADLDAQAELIRDDRVQIFEMVRQSDQAANLALQKANQAARAVAAGGEAQLKVRIESPQVAVYGNTAVVSFVRLFNVIPHNSDPLPVGVAFFTMVLVKEGRNWGIAHLHGSNSN